jgi:hypothetical protein
VLFVHGVNPWGMAWWRRQNESNVDLNRNWRRDDGEPFENEAYEELHALACPDTPELPSIGDLASTAQALVDARGLAWVRDGITAGQYRHPDGLHYGGARIGPGHILSRRLRSGRGDDRKSRCDDRPEGGSDRERFARRASARNVFLDITGVRYEFRSRTAAGHLPRTMGVPAWRPPQHCSPQRDVGVPLLLHTRRSGMGARLDAYGTRPPRPRTRRTRRLGLTGYWRVA